MNELALPSVQPSDGSNADQIVKYLSRIQQAVAKIQTFSVVFNPASVAANSESVQTIAIAGVTLKDIITINKPTNTAGLDLISAWVSAAGVVSVKFRNQTGSPIDAGSETYLVTAVRL